ncbi:MAG: exo-alpha-sialidase [Fibrobacteres bacterium]|nr:exo-alpha-sialidase [Fibrobacterota bacterium]
MSKSVFCAVAVSAALLAAPLEAAYTWKSVQILGGGYVPGVAFHPTAKGVAYNRTDVGGAYRLAANGKDWVAINDGFASANDMGSIAIGLDPADPNAVYLTGGLYLTIAWAGPASFFRSTDQGATWTKIPLTTTNVTGTKSTMVNKDGALCLGGNEGTRGAGPRIAAKGSTLYLGTNQNGLLQSTDKGDTWTTVTALGDTGVSAVLFDDAGNVYAAPYAGGLYMSTNGTTWTQLTGFTGKIYQMGYAKTTNTIWITSNATKPLDQNEGGGGSVWTFDATAKTFAKVTMPEKGGKDYGYGGVSVNPANAQQILISTVGWWRGKDSPKTPATFVPHEAIFQSLDGGKTWTDILGNGNLDGASAFSSVTSNPHWLTALAVDPSNPEHVIFGTGYGVWSTENASAAKPIWSFTNKGLEETVPLGLVSSTVGAPLVSVVGDVDGYYHTDLDVPPTTRHQIEAGTNFDLSVAGKAPTKMVRIFKEATKGLGAYSEDAGKTWTAFKTYPPFVQGQYSTSPTYTNETNYAAISADGSSIVWNMQTHGVYFSKDKGATWTKSTTAASLLANSFVGFRVVADRVTAGTFYIYNAATGILYRSVDDGANWTVMNSTLQKVDDWAYNYMRVYASPKAAGVLWITQGQQDPPAMWLGENIVYRSIDGGATLEEMSTLKSATAIGFGKGLTSDIPAIYAYGLKGSSKGLFRSTDDGATWTRIDAAGHQYGGFGMITGDPCIFSRIYVSGGAARGILYAEDGVNANSCPDRIDNKGGSSVSGRATNLDGIRRQGGRLVSSWAFVLTTLDGREVRHSTPSAQGASLSLEGLHKGLYVAQGAGSSTKISVF